MGLGKALNRRPREAVHNRAITEFAIIDGKPVYGSESSLSYRGALSIPGAWRASNLIADLLGSVPWNAYMGTEKFVPPLLEQPSPPDTRMTTFSSWALDLVWHGNAIGVVAARDFEGTPTAVYPVPAEQVGVRRVSERYYPLPRGAIEYQIGGLSFGADQMLHIKGPCPPGALRGMGVLEAHLSGALEVSKEQMRQALSLADAGVPTGLLSTDNPDVPPDYLKTMKDSWLESQRSRTIAALGGGMKFQALAWSPTDGQMIEARQYQLTDLENIFGLPVGWLGGHNSARQYSNIEQDAVNLIKFTLSGHLARFEGALSQAFPLGTEVKANLDSILRADTLTRYRAHEIALRNKWAVINEVRALEDEPPVPWGNEPVDTGPARAPEPFPDDDPEPEVQ